ncbi:unnamed protein product [Prunus brigantina]
MEEQSMKLKGSRGDAYLRSLLMVAGRLAATKLDSSMWVRRHPLLLLVFSPTLEEERMEMLDIFHDVGLGYCYWANPSLSCLPICLGSRNWLEFWCFQATQNFHFLAHQWAL